MNKKYLKIGAIILAVIIILGAGYCMFLKEKRFTPTAVPVGWSTYTNTTYGFSVQHPAETSIDTSKPAIKIVGFPMTSGASSTMSIRPNKFDLQTYYAIDIYVDENEHYRYDFAQDTWHFFEGRGDETPKFTYTWNEFLKLENGWKQTLDVGTQSGLPIFVLSKETSKRSYRYFLVIDRDHDLGITFSYDQAKPGSKEVRTAEWDADLKANTKMITDIAGSYAVTK